MKKLQSLMRQAKIGATLVTALLYGLHDAYSPARADELALSWEVKTPQGEVTRDLIIGNTYRAYVNVKKIRGTNPTISLLFGTTFPKGVKVVRAAVPEKGDFFCQTPETCYEMSPASNKAFEDFCIRETKFRADSTGRLASKGPASGEGAVAVYELLITEEALGQGDFRIRRASADSNEFVPEEERHQKVTYEDLHTAVVRTPAQRTGPYLVRYMQRNPATGKNAFHVYISEIPGQNSTLEYIDGTLPLAAETGGTGSSNPEYPWKPLAANTTGKSWEYVDQSTANSTIRFYRARSNGSTPVSAVPASLSKTLETMVSNK